MFANDIKLNIILGGATFKNSIRKIVCQLHSLSCYWKLIEILHHSICLSSHQCFFEISDCFSRERSGYKFFSFRVRDIFNAIDIESCSSQCGRSFNCKSFSYSRYKSVDNCHISDVDLRFADNLLDDITSDPDWDLYRQSDITKCTSTSGGSGGKKIQLQIQFSSKVFIVKMRWRGFYFFSVPPFKKPSFSTVNLLRERPFKKWCKVLNFYE